MPRGACPHMTIEPRSHSQSRTAPSGQHDTMRLSIIALSLVAVTVACTKRSAHVGPAEPSVGGKPSVVAPDELVPEIVEEPRPQPAPCIDSSRTVSLADSGSYYPPSPTSIFLPPLPIPRDVRGFRLIAEFDVTLCGATLTGMSRSPNANYNRLLQAVLRTMQFRPAVSADGRPVRAKARIVQDL